MVPVAKPAIAGSRPFVLRIPTEPPTPREAAVLELVALGLSSREIGERLWVSRQAITYHIGNLLSKFAVESRTGLVARAYSMGVMQPDAWPPRLAPGYAAGAWERGRETSAHRSELVDAAPLLQLTKPAPGRSREG